MNEGHHQLERLLQIYEGVFKEDLGMRKSATATLHTKPDVIPKFFKPQPVPYAIRESLQNKLGRLESAGIIENVEHSDWAAPVVLVPRSDEKLHLCGKSNN